MQLNNYWWKWWCCLGQHGFSSKRWYCYSIPTVPVPHTSLIGGEPSLYLEILGLQNCKDRIITYVWRSNFMNDQLILGHITGPSGMVNKVHYPRKSYIMIHETNGDLASVCMAMVVISSFSPKAKTWACHFQKKWNQEFQEKCERPILSYRHYNIVEFKGQSSCCKLFFLLLLLMRLCIIDEQWMVGIYKGF